MEPAQWPTEQLKKLERDVRIQEKKLQRSEADRVLLEDTREKNDSLLRTVIGELRESQAEIARKSAALERTLEELKTTQDELIESAKMAALGALVAGVAHEVNTPLGIGVTAASHLENLSREFAVHMSGQEICRETAERFVEGSRQSSEIILNNLRRAADLISSFKLVAVDQTSQSMREYNLYDYLGEIVVSLSNRLKRSRITVEISGDQMLSVFGDPGLLSQVITNLVINALMHAYEQGQSGNLVIRFLAKEEWLHIQFEDNGKGIDPDHLGKIFDPFFTTKRGAGGSGLGLNIVYNVVRRQMAGKIQCQSTVGEGTRFLMKIPLRALCEPVAGTDQAIA